MKFLKISVLSLFCFPLYTTNIISATNVNLHSVNDDISKADYSHWVDVIKNFNSDNIQLFVTRDATLIYQQSLIATNYMIQTNQLSDLNLYWIINEQDYIDKKWNFNYFSNDFKNQVQLIKNIKDLNENIDKPYLNWLDQEMIYQFLNKFESINKEFKLDLWIADINIETIWKEAEYQNETLPFYNLLKHLNKINILSDGNYQTKYFANAFVNRLNTLNFQLSKKDAQKKIESFQSDTNNYLYDEFEKTTIFDYLLDDDFINVFNVANYYDSPYFKLDNKFTFYNVYLYQYDYYSMGQLLFENDVNKLNTFIKLYESFFNWNIQNFTDLIASESKNKNYDPKKPNIFYIGDSLITSEDDFFPERKEELNKLTKAMLKKYDPSKYNWLFSGHPRYTYETLVYLNEYIFDENFNPIYLKSFPWEMLLSWDNKMSQQFPLSVYRPFFGQNSNSNDWSWSTLVGLQYTSTVIETTWFFLKNNYCLSDEAAYLPINAGNFPISKTFDILRQTTSYNFQPELNYEKNYNHIIEIHDPYYDLNEFYDYKKDLIDTKTFINNQGIDYNYPTANKNIIIFITVPIIGIIILLASTLIYIKIRKNKKRSKKDEIKK